MSDNEIFDKIRRMLDEHNYDKINISKKTKISDFNVVSDHVDDFFIEYSEKFKIDMKDIRSQMYFFDDSIPFSSFILIFKSKILKKKTMRLAITVEHLIEVAKRGEWFAPVEKVYYEVRW